MSIYHHFPNKAHLMDALVDLMLAEARVAEAGEGIGSNACVGPRTVFARWR